MQKCIVISQWIFIFSTNIPRCLQILVSYSWQPHIIAPYSKRCMYSCVIFLATLYYCTIFSKVCLLYSCVIFSATSYYCTIFQKVCLLYSCVIFLATSYYCTIFQEVCLLYSCVIFLVTSYYCTIFQGVCILVSYSQQPHIIAPYSERCTYCFLVSYSW